MNGIYEVHLYINVLIDIVAFLQILIERSEMRECMLGSGTFRSVCHLLAKIQITVTCIGKCSTCLVFVIVLQE